MSEKNRRVWFITDGSQGLNSILTKQLISRGEDVVKNARQSEQLKELKTQYPKKAISFPVDVTNPKLLEEAVDRALEAFERMDFVVNSPGYGLISALGEQTAKNSRIALDFQVF